LPNPNQVKLPNLEQLVHPTQVKRFTHTQPFDSLHTFSSNRRARLILKSAVLARDVETKLPGIYWRNAKNKYILDFDWMIKGSIRQRIVGAIRFFFGGGLLSFFRIMRGTYVRKIPIKIHDARAKEREEGLSKTEFFNKYGFVLLEHNSTMSAEGWQESDTDLNEMIKTFNDDDGDQYIKVMDEYRNGDTPVKHIYSEEIKNLVGSVLPNVKKVMPPAKGIRRYVTNNPNKAFAKTVHNDYGLVFDEVSENPFFDFKLQREEYDKADAKEYMLVNFWRPILPMKKPCRSNPLGFLDSSTVSPDDFVTVDSKSLGVATQLKENPKHKYYFYPDMTTNEVVMFKQFHQVRHESIARMPVFHTAFADPAANKETEGRVSFEYRVGLLL